MSAPASSSAPRSADAWLAVVGCLPDGTLAAGAPADALAAEAVFGATRLLEAAAVPVHARRPWPRPFADGLAALLRRRGRPTTVLASGDPLHFGVGATLVRALPAEEMNVFPAPSAFSLAAAALRWPLEEVRCVSLHAAPPADILLHARADTRLLVLTRDGATPTAIARSLAEGGWGDSGVAVLERLGTPQAAVHRARASTLGGRFEALNVLAVECASARAGPIAADALEHDGCVTRDEIRTLAVAALSPPGHLWDVGAGSGAVTIDFCRVGGSATAFERHPDRVAALRRNLAATATRASVLEGEAADRLDGAAPPTRIFLGGAVSDTALFEALWERLAPGGILVSNAVTVEAEAATLARHAALGGRLTRIALSHEAPLGTLRALRPALPVLQWRVVKP